MQIINAKFLTSISTSQSYESIFGNEICMVGRSNVGKSSLINSITGRGIARTSSQPGRTRLINMFDVNDGQFTLVDLPGYGYSEASKQQKNDWQLMIEGYLSKSTQLKCVFVLVDCRHNSPLDLQMLAYLYHYQFPFCILATKSDKLSKAQLNKRIIELAAFLRVGKDNIISVSNNGSGREQVLSKIEQILT